jgi:glycosyltransferase involved in cell wall biosynthesis
VLFESLGKPHSLYRHLLEDPPKGFEFRVRSEIGGKTSDFFRRTNIFKMIALEGVSGFVPPSMIGSMLQTLKTRPDECELTYSAGHLIFRDENWVMDCEHLGQLVGYNGRLLPRYLGTIERSLRKSNCTRILPWSHMAMRTIEKNIEDKKIVGKAEIVELARRSIPIEKRKHEGVRILFIGSANFPSILTSAQRGFQEGISHFTGHCTFLAHENFYSKGGLLAVEAFSRVADKYEDIEFVIRSYIPEEMKKRIREVPRVTVEERLLTATQMEELFLSSDIFLFPSHMTPGMAFLDAMNFELPIITTNACNNEEFVCNGVNGVVCKTPSRVPYWFSNDLPAGASYAHMKAIQSSDGEVVSEIAAAIMKLVESDSDRTQMGRRGKALLETGPHSTFVRNERLRRIFEESMRK